MKKAISVGLIALLICSGAMAKRPAVDVNIKIEHKEGHGKDGHERRNGKKGDSGIFYGNDGGNGMDGHRGQDGGHGGHGGGGLIKGGNGGHGGNSYE